MNTSEDILSLANAFKLFAACFYEPDLQLLREENVCDNLAILLNSLAPESSLSAQDMKAGLENTTEQYLSIDYAALFVGPFELIAPPYGSVYLEGKRQVLGKSTLDIQKFYLDADLTVDIHEPADHIAIELEFMHYLLVQEANARHDNNDDLADTLRNLQEEFFLQAMNWIPEFCKLQIKGAETQFYKALAECLEQFHYSCSQRVYVSISEMAYIPCQ